MLLLLYFDVVVVVTVVFLFWWQLWTIIDFIDVHFSLALCFLLYD